MKFAIKVSSGFFSEEQIVAGLTKLELTMIIIHIVVIIAVFIIVLVHGNKIDK
ncbi:hypothetical protein [Sedimentibacter sp. LTW-03]|uniref:hypothetical protein n=1 Tax=Sedimentibacter sp. LTW-03 TaxID=3453406 RepID=UPI003F872376